MCYEASLKADKNSRTKNGWDLSKQFNCNWGCLLTVHKMCMHVKNVLYYNISLLLKVTII